tara:strand:- start:563 stop:1150 length:588 start_codon:yes stop_codon:yes gene_type:complete
MNYSFEYIDIILLAMIAGFIFLRLRGILGRKSEFDNKVSTDFSPEFVKETTKRPLNEMTFDDDAKNNFINGAKIAYENIITSFSVGNLSSVKNLLDKKIYDQFQDALKERSKNGQVSEMTFIGINSAEIKNHENKNGFLEVTVDFISEIISCVKNKESKIISGDPKKVKKVYDTWKFSRNIKSNNPNWLLVETES